MAVFLAYGERNAHPLTRFPFHGQLSGTPPNVTYTPRPGFTGTDAFRFRVNDGTVTSNEDGIVTLTVGANQAPTATAQSVKTNEDTPLAITLSGTDPENAPLTFTIGTQPTKGSLSGTPPNLTYTPTPNANGPDSFTFTVNDGTLTSLPATVAITITPINDPPLAAPANVTTGEGIPVNITLVGSDVDNDPLTFSIVTTPTNGSLSGAAPNLIYTPNANFMGTDAFTFRVNDGTVNSAPAQVAITVTGFDDPPLAVTDTATVAEDAPATPITVLANDTDVDGGPISITSVTQPANGTVVITNGGADLTYQPDPNYCNTPPGTTLDVFTYTLTPGGSTATVTVTVTCGNDAPVVDLDGTADDPGGDIDYAATFTEGTPAVIVDAANLTVTDPDSATLTVAIITLTNLQDAGLETLAATTTGTTITANYAAPILTLTGPDTLANYQQVLRTVTYNNTAPNPNTTARLIDFVVNDGTDDSAVATSTVTINAINTAPSFTKGPDQTINEDAGAQTVNGWATAITDGDGNTQTLTFNVPNNTNPSLFSAGPSVDATTGTLTYTPAANANGSATITITLSDNGGTANGGVDTSAPQTFLITVNSVNDVPSFTAATPPTVNENAGAQTVTNWATFSAGPANESGQTVLAYAVSNISNAGLFSALPAVAPNGTLTYTPAANASGASTFQVTVQDSGGTANGGVDTSAPQTFTITVNIVDDPPVAVDDSATVPEDAPATTIAVLGNDTDIDGGPLSMASVTQPANGTVVNNGTDVSYTPVPDYCNTPPGTTLDTFTYTLTPGGSTATVSVTVDCVNDTPVLDLDADDSAGANGVNYAVTFTEGGSAITLSNGIGITDPDDTNLEAAAVNLPTFPDGAAEVLTINNALATGFGITATLAPDGHSISLTGTASLDQYRQVLETVQYNNSSPNPTDTPVRTVTFTVNDGAADSAVATSTVTINAINSAPSFTVGPNQTVNEDAGAQTVNPWAAAINDGDGGGQTLTFNVTGNTNAALFSAGPAISSAGVLTYTPAANANGTATITITLSDNGGTANGGVDTSAPQNFTITVNAVNDAPSFTVGPNQTVLEDSGPQTVNPWATGISPGPADEASQTVTFNITGNTNAALFVAGPTISPTGVLTYTPAAQANGSATIILTLSDNGGTANGGVDTAPAQTFTITVTAVNDPPSFTKGADQTVLEDAGAQSVAGWAPALADGDPEVTQTLTFNVTGNTNPTLFSAGPSVNATTGTLTYTPAANANGSATLTLTLSDNGGTANSGVNTSPAQTFTITVTAVNDPPVAAVQSYNAQANMGVRFSGLLSGATDPDSGDAGFTLVLQLNSVSPCAGCTVSIVNAATGTVDFVPPPGTTGVVTFTYQIQDNGNPGVAVSAPATVTVTISGPVIWFVDDSAAAGGNGTLNQPFQTLGSVSLVDNANDRVFLFSGTYAAGLALLSGEQLIGQGVTGVSFDTVFGITPPGDARHDTINRPTIGGTRPIVQGTITLNTDAVVRGLNLATATTALTDPAGATTGVTVSEVDITSTATAMNFDTLSGSLTFGSVTSTGGTNNITLSNVDGTVGLGTGTLSGATGTAFNVSGGTASISYAGSVDKTAVGATVGRLVSITGKTGGSVALSGNLAASGAGATGLLVQNNNAGAPTISFTGTSKSFNTGASTAITLNANTGATINFSGGGLVITTTSGTGFNATGGAAAVNVTGTGNTITSTTGTALNVTSTTIGASGLTFRSISASGATNGIVLNTTGSSGGLTVTGTGSAGTGGTIQNTTGQGILLTSTSAVNLSFMNISGSDDDGIRGSSVTGLSLTGVQVTSSGDAAGEAGIDLTNLLGTSTWSSITVSGSAEDNVVIRNSSGTLTSLNVTASTFSNNSAIGNDGFLMEASGTATMIASLTGNTFSAHRGDHFQAAAASSGILDVVFSNNTLSGGHATALGQGITINAATGVPGYNGTVDYNIDNNTINGAILSAITVNLGTSANTANMRGTISGNTIGTTGQPLSCSTQAYGIAVDAHGNGTHTVAVTNNTIRRCADRGMGVLANDGNGALNLTVTANTVTEMLDDNVPNGTPREAIELNLGATSTNIFGQIDSHAICLALGGTGALRNSLTGGTFKNGDIRLRQRFRTRVVLPGYTPPGGNNFDTASVITFLQGNNLPAGVTATATTNNDAGVTTDGYFGGAACPTPP